MTQADQKKAREKIILEEQFDVYWKSVINESTDSLSSEMKLEHPATVATNFEMSLATEMGSAPYFGDPTINHVSYQQWADEGNDKYSSALMALRNKTVERFVHDVSRGDMVNEKLTKSEENLVSNVLVLDDFAPVSKLFASALLDMVKVGKYSKSADKAGVIDRFLSYWGKILLIPQHEESLENLSQFMKGDFDGFASGKKKLSGLTQEKLEALSVVLRQQQS